MFFIILSLIYILAIYWLVLVLEVIYKKLDKSVFLLIMKI
jgi:hypothetical protein